MKSYALWLLPVGFLAVFFFYPLAEITITSLARSPGGWAAPFEEVFASARLRGVIGFTFGQAALSTILTLIVGLPGAFLVGRYRFRGKSLLLALTAIPFVMPTLVVAAAFNAMLGPRGWLNLGLMTLFGWDIPPLPFSGTLGAILVAHVFYNTTIILRTVGDFWSRLDPRLEQAARVLGANRWQTFCGVTLPLLGPAIGAAALLVFLFDFTSFGVILILGEGRFATLEVEIFNQVTGVFNLPRAAALSLIQLACTLALTAVYTRLSARLSRPLTLRPQTFAQRPLTGWKIRLAAGLIAAALGFLLVAPLAGLAARSVLRVDSKDRQPLGLTLEYYRELNLNRRGSAFYAPPAAAIGVSLGYAAISVGLALTLGLPAAWRLARRPGAIDSRIFEPILMLPLGASAVTLGLGFLVALDRPPLDLRASPLLIPLAQTLAALPFVVRSLSPALRSIRPRLHQAAAVLGASPQQTFWAIDLPMLGRAVLVAAAYAFTISLGEFGATALIARPEFPTLPVAIYRFLGQPGAIHYGQALALSTILMAVCAAGMLAIERVRVGANEF